MALALLTNKLSLSLNFGQIVYIKISGMGAPSDVFRA